MNLAVVRFCAEEVERQQRGPLQVWWMVEAWQRARQDYGEAQGANWRVQGESPFRLDQVQNWAALIERTANQPGRWRFMNVRVGDRLCPAPESLADLTKRWAGNLPDMTAAEAYKEFEEIHPFRDGNGRVGKIIFNWLNHTLEEPVLPPNFWGIENP